VSHECFFADVNKIALLSAAAALLGPYSVLLDRMASANQDVRGLALAGADA